TSSTKTTNAFSENEPISATNWGLIAKNLDLGGMNRQLILGSRFYRLEQDNLMISCQNAPKTMLTPDRMQQIVDALKNTLGKKLHLEIVDDDDNALGESARQIQQRIEKEKQQQAQHIIDNHPLVNDVLNKFNGKIREDSIHPLDQK
ncbi:MAG: hypothetical protein COW84_02115, partial [Gammaproteobacteria bacterium CG22_combo_CG10-13_8_21_14_all_40_8]